MLANRGIVTRLLGDLDEAIRLQRLVLVYQRDKQGDYKEGIGGALDNNLGIVESLRGNYRAAAEPSSGR